MSTLDVLDAEQVTDAVELTRVRSRMQVLADFSVKIANERMAAAIKFSREENLHGGRIHFDQGTLLHQYLDVCSEVFNRSPLLS